MVTGEVRSETCVWEITRSAFTVGPKLRGAGFRTSGFALFCYAMVLLMDEHRRATPPHSRTSTRRDFYETYSMSDDARGPGLCLHVVKVLLHFLGVREAREASFVALIAFRGNS